MAVYIVTYDLNNETVRPKITEEVDATAWAKLSEQSYAIDTEETPEQVYASFSKHLDSDDSFYVITLSKPYFGQGEQEVHTWLADRLLQLFSHHFQQGMLQGSTFHDPSAA